MLGNWNPKRRTRNLLILAGLLLAATATSGFAWAWNGVSEERAFRKGIYEMTVAMSKIEPCFEEEEAYVPNQPMTTAR